MSTSTSIPSERPVSFHPISMRIVTGITVLAATVWSQAPRLVSQQRLVFGLTTDTTFTRFDYDDQGNRVALRGYASADTASARLGVTTYEYSPGGRLLREVARVGSDTLSDVLYAYGLQAQPVTVTVRGKSGILRYTDSLAYDGKGNMTWENRFSATGSAIFRRQHLWDGAGLALGDTLFEPDGAGWKALSARIVSHNPDGTVSGEVFSRLDGEIWIVSKSTTLGYAAGRLAYVLSNEGDGPGTLRADSTAYAYNGSGNRSRESIFDGDGALVERTEYQWENATVRLRWAETALHEMRHEGRLLSRGVLAIGRNSYVTLRGQRVETLPGAALSRAFAREARP